MDAVLPAPTVLDIPVWCAPKKVPCPTCGKLAKRVRTVPRQVRTIAYKQIAQLQILCGEYQARCGCCTTFRTSPEGVLPRAKYDNKVRQAVLDRIIDDGMNVEATLRSLKRDFLLDLSTGFVYDCLHDAAAQLDMAQHRQRVLREFSGTLCVDELHLGHYLYCGVLGARSSEVPRSGGVGETGLEVHRPTVRDRACVAATRHARTHCSAEDDSVGSVGSDLELVEGYHSGGSRD